MAKRELVVVPNKTYEKYYQEFSNEVHKAIGSFLFWKMLQNRVASEPKLLDGLNNTPLSWIMIRHALQVTLFMTLGRIFDIDDEAFSADDLLKTCINDIDIFSSSNLRIRKMEDQQKEPEWLDEYIDAAYVPDINDFQRLRGELSKHRKIFEQVYRPIRHKLIAHTDKKFIGKADDLWKETNIVEIEELMKFLHDLQCTLFEQYQNGTKPTLQGRNIDCDFYESDYAQLLDLVKSA